MHATQTVAGSTHGTRVAPRSRTPMPSGESPFEARRWVELLHELSAARAERLDEAMLVVVVKPPGRAALRRRLRFLPANEAGPLALVLGRHPACDVAGLTDGSLRHALVLAWPGSDRPLAVHDLRSNTGLVLSRQRRAHRLRGCSHLRFCAGRDDVTVLYAAPGSPLEVGLPHELDAWVEVERQAAAVDERYTKRSEPVRLNNASVVTRVGQTLLRQLDRAVVDARGKEVLKVTSRELAAGVLLGRYARCDHSSWFAYDETVSRVHAFAIARDEDLYVIDVGSTNGTHVVRLGEPGEGVLLDDVNRVHRLAAREGVRIGERPVLFELVSEDYPRNQAR